MRVSLSGWQRIGVIISIIWVVGAPIYMDSAAQKAALEDFSFTYHVCREAQSSKDADAYPNRCFSEATRSSELLPRYTLAPKDRINVALVAFAPLPVGWLAMYALVLLGRWVRAGFGPAGE
jgi:hypothetical protein